MADGGGTVKKQPKWVEGPIKLVESDPKVIQTWRTLWKQREFWQAYAVLTRARGKLEENMSFLVDLIENSGAEPKDYLQIIQPYIDGGISGVKNAQNVNASDIKCYACALNLAAVKKEPGDTSDEPASEVKCWACAQNLAAVKEEPGDTSDEDEPTPQVVSGIGSRRRPFRNTTVRRKLFK